MEFDTKEIIFNKRVEEKKNYKEIQKVISQKSHEQKRLLQIENEELVTDKPSTEFKKALQHARSIQGLSQRDLALRMNIKQNIITDWENGKYKPTPNEKSQLQRILNTKLPK
jgi:ribosome-binding protein aMBF1 (putative translation factor)